MQVAVENSIVSVRQRRRPLLWSEPGSKSQTLVLDFFSFILSRFSCTSHSFLARLSASLSTNASVIFFCSTLIDRFMKLSSSSNRCFNDANCCSVKNSVSTLLRKISYFNSKISWLSMIISRRMRRIICYNKHYVRMKVNSVQTSMYNDIELCLSFTIIKFIIRFASKCLSWNFIAMTSDFKLFEDK